MKKVLELKITPAKNEEITYILENLKKFNRKSLGLDLKHKSLFLNYIIKENNKIIAGIESALHFYEVLHINTLFIEEEYRHRGL